MKRDSSNKQNQSQAYISTKGIFRPQLRCVTSISGFYNSKRGTLEVLVCNESQNDVTIHRNTRVGTFATLSESGTINRLYKLLKLDELTHLTAEQIDQVKALVTEFKQIVSEHEKDIGFFKFFIENFKIIIKTFNTLINEK